MDSQRNQSLSNLFSIDSQGFIRTLVVLDRELQSNYNLSVFIYDSMLKSYSLPTYIVIQLVDENDNLPYEPFLSNPFDLSVEQINNDETVIYEFKPLDLDEGLNGVVSIHCVNCTLTPYFHLLANNRTNSTILLTRANVTVPDDVYTLAFILRDHGAIVSRERLYTLKFNFTHRLIDGDDEHEFDTTASVPFLSKPKHLFSTLSMHKFQSHFLVVLFTCWIVLVLLALWTCYRHERMSNKHQQEKDQQQQQLESQVRQHEIVTQSIQILPKSSSLPIDSQRPFGKETLTQDDDEIEDTSYDADHIITDANFVLTSGCTPNESNIRYVSSLPSLLPPKEYRH